MPRRGRATRSAKSGPGSMLLHKLVMFGDGGVGKTALVIQFCLQDFVEKYEPTVEDSYRKSVHIDGASCMLEVLDTSSDEQYAAIRDDWVREGEAFLLVYSITSRSSFSRVKLFHDRILRVQAATGCEPSPICLIGNKRDRISEREVTTTEGLNLALGLGVDYFVECSAKNNVNVENAFFDLVRVLRVQGEIKKRRYEKKPGLFGSQLTMPSGENDLDSGGDKLARCLLHAVRTNNVKEAVEFLNAGADPNTQPTLSGSALHAAAAFGYLGLTNILLKRGARVNATAAHESGTSPLQDAAIGGHLEVLKLLLHHGARLDQESTLRGTALHAAASRGHTQVVEYLLKQGADATKRGGPYEFALHAGAWYGSESVVTSLLNGGADIGAETADGCTALHMSAFTGSLGVIEILLDRGARRMMNAVSEKFGTVLDAAGDNGHFEAVKILLEAGAKTHFGDRERDGHAVKPTILDPEQRAPSKLAMLPSDTDTHIEGLYDAVEGGDGGNHQLVLAKCRP
ncbi:ankyrin repeat-containing domain protein [Dactylonectria estremocensis]|uniref:Ankyrin repeat-containing domain protein n=1 Tax=Dactylonectria estremocensis TaxID=1079267 RepID=A0A9P9EG67_9HYPO|nr:ankyrin repeat-containing domain protein [Dactylonectria estremocensis]